MTTVVDTDGEPMRHARARRARRRSRRTCSRPRSSSATSSTTSEDRVDRRRARCVELGAREAIMTLPDGCVARVLGRRARRAATACRIEPREAVAASAPATRSWPATSPRATRARRRRSACATASPAAPSRPSASAPGVVDPREVERLLGEVEVAARSRRRPRSAEPAHRALGRSARGPAAILESVAGCRPPRLQARSSDPACAGSFRPPPSLGSSDGDRDRPRQEGPPRLWIRRHRDRALAAHA